MIPVVIPAKPLSIALRRLATIMDAEARRAMQAAMLTDVLTAAAAFSGDVIVVTSDPAVADLAHLHGARVAPDAEPAAGINVAVERGLAACGSADQVLVVMGDLPMASEADLRGVAAASPAAGGVVLAVSADGSGTNAMLMRPPHAIRPSFGDGSLTRHLRHASEAAIECTVVTAPGLMLDIDTPADLDLLMRSGIDCQTTRLCVGLDLSELATLAGQ